MLATARSELRRAQDLVQGLLPWPRRAPKERGEAMFGVIRRRLTLWYSLVLLGALVVFGAALYVGVSQALFDPIDHALASQAQTFSDRWQSTNGLSCSFGLGPEQRATWWACFGQNGFDTQISQPLNEYNQYYSQYFSLTSDFNNSAAVKGAWQSGHAYSTIDEGGGLGYIRLYALAVHNPVDNGLIGAVVIGTTVDGQVTALHVLLVLLLALGAFALLVAIFGGLFLSSRALVPARLAFARQQSFIADASHELRTPLTLLRADAEVLLRGGHDLPPEDHMLLEDIVAETAHMTALAGTMLTLARLDADRLHIERDVVDLAVVATRVAGRATALAREKEVTVEIQGSEETAPVLVIGDRLLLEQVALILVDNAIKYNRPGGHITLSAHRDGADALFEVSDTGIGIAREHLPRLGERFYRVDKARSREAGGAGLGLSIAHGVAVAHGGSLTLTSTPGVGTTARLRLPGLVESRK